MGWHGLQRVVGIKRPWGTSPPWLPDMRETQQDQLGGPGLQQTETTGVSSNPKQPAGKLVGDRLTSDASKSPFQLWRGPSTNRAENKLNQGGLPSSQEHWTPWEEPGDEVPRRETSFPKEKAEGSLFTVEEGGTGHSRTEKESRGGAELGEMTAGGNGCEMGPTPILTPGPAKQGSFCWLRLWASGRGSERQSLSPGREKRDRRWQCQGLGKGA